MLHILIIIDDVSRLLCKSWIVLICAWLIRHILIFTEDIPGVSVEEALAVSMPTMNTITVQILNTVVQYFVSIHSLYVFIVFIVFKRMTSSNSIDLASYSNFNGIFEIGIPRYLCLPNFRLLSPCTAEK